MNKPAKIILTFACLCSLAAGAAPALDQLSFRDGDFIYGKLLAIDPQNGVRWEHPDATQPVQFKSGNIAEINFSAQNPGGARSNRACKLLFANGNLCEGNLASCDKEFVTLDTWYAGQLKIARKALQSLAFIPTAPPVYEGPTGLEGWTAGLSTGAFAGDSGQWTYRNGAFYAEKSASIARDWKLPDVAEIQFDVAWTGLLNMAVALYTDSLQPILLSNKENGPDFGGFYSLRLSGNVAELFPIKKHDPLKSLGQAFPLPVNEKTRMHIDLRVSKPKRKVALFVNETLVKEWVDPDGFAGEGTGIRFVHQGMGAVKLSNMRVTEWDGILDDRFAAVPDPTRDAVWLKSGARLEGKVEITADGKVTLDTGARKIEFATEQVREIEFSEQPGSKVVDAGANVRATFALGGNLTFQLESWSPAGVKLRSPNFGEAKFNPAVFARFQFLR